MGIIKVRVQATVNLNFPSERHLQIVLEALKPETRISSNRSKVQAEGKNNQLTMTFKAKDTSALRTALNSYLRWITVINDVCSAMEAIEK